MAEAERTGYDYVFVIGNGDDAHAEAINKRARDRYRAVMMLVDPDAFAPQRVRVLMERYG